MAKTNREVVKMALQKTTKFKAISTSKLEKITGICPQGIRGAINELRSLKVPVCAGQNGYYIEKNREAVKRYADELELKAGGILRAVRGLRSYANFK